MDGKADAGATGCSEAHGRGSGRGMVMLNDTLYGLVQKDTVEPRDAYLKAGDKTGFEVMLTKGGYKI